MPSHLCQSLTHSTLSILLIIHTYVQYVVCTHHTVPALSATSACFTTTTCFCHEPTPIVHLWFASPSTAFLSSLTSCASTQHCLLVKEKQASNNSQASVWGRGFPPTVAASQQRGDAGWCTSLCWGVCPSARSEGRWWHAEWPAAPVTWETRSSVALQWTEVGACTQHSVQSYRDNASVCVMGRDMCIGEDMKASEL